jgi:(p)ppGpp synthase/HD superfamily hydrolase
VRCTAIHDKQLAAGGLAASLHEGQVDKAEHPYIGHLMRVVANLHRRFPDATQAA